LWHGALLGVGIALQILSRPFEAVFMSIVTLAYLLLECRVTWKSGLQLGLLFGAIVALALGLTALQNKVVTGSWKTLPYVLSRYQYGVPTTFTFQSNPMPHRHLTPEQELDYKAQVAIHGPGTDSIHSYLTRLAYRVRYLRFFLLPPFYIGMFAFIPRLRERRYLWAAGTLLLFALGTNFYSYFFPHYVAAVGCLLLLLALAGMEKLGKTINLYVFAVCATSFAFWFGLYVFGETDYLSVMNYQAWDYVNTGDPQGRIAVRRRLLEAPGEQLVFVHYAPFHHFEEWIHNNADIDSAKIVWANDLGTEEDKKLIRFYPNRTAWLLQPDNHPISLVQYPTDSGIIESVH
jgi:hypothetical protein